MSTKVAEGSRDPAPPSSERATLTGWAAVENEMLKHDKGTMEGHLSDIDTLLVFAGLFSAVLTAFVVESYQQLQLDTGTGSMLVLRRISVQLETFTLSPGFANSTSTAPPLPSLDFVADSTTRWINALWFLSLVFSLASALFGILVKQWIREYMQWNAALASPRDNVLVRQIRFEAWNTWNVPATIASIPALLELALVFFVSGLVILLWTLDPVVSIVITTSAAVFLAIASTLTILPAFFKRCPYKSPTAWACAVAWDFFTLWIPFAIGRLGRKVYYSSHFKFTETVGEWMMGSSDMEKWRVGNWTAISSDWRARDLVNLWSSFCHGREGDATAFLNTLIPEQSCADSNHECPMRRDAISTWRLPSSRAAARLPLHDALRTITELPHLIRALAWVSQASQGVHIQHSVSHCVESLESRFVLSKPMVKTTQGGFALTQEGVRSLSIWHVLLSFCRRNELVPDEEPADLTDIFTLRTSIMKGSTYPRACDEANGMRTLCDIDSVLENRATKDSLPAVSIFVSLCAASVKSIIDELTSSNDDDYALDIVQNRRAMSILAILYSCRITNFNDLRIRNAATCLVDILRATGGAKRQPFESKYPGLRNQIRVLARHYLGKRFPQELKIESENRPHVTHPVQDTQEVCSNSMGPILSSVGSEEVATIPQQHPTGSTGPEDTQISRGDVRVVSLSFASAQNPPPSSSFAAMASAPSSFAKPTETLSMDIGDSAPAGGIDAVDVAEIRGECTPKPSLPHTSSPSVPTTSHADTQSLAERPDANSNSHQERLPQDDEDVA